MPLYFIEKETLQATAPLSDKEKCILQTPQNYDHLSRKVFADKLINLKENYWIKCDCTTEIAILVICKKISGGVYIRSRTREEHSTDCLFAKNDIELFSQQMRQYQPTLGFKSMKTAYATLKGFELMRMFKKCQMKCWYYGQGIMGEVRLVERQFGF